MASIHLQGILVDSVGEIDVGGVITFTHLTTTGDTIASTQTELIIPPDGAYSIDVEYGQIRIDYTTRNTERFVANVIVNSASTATSLPELLSATTPVAKPIIIQMQGLVADATAAATTAEAFADQLTTTELIASSATFAPNTNITTKGYTTSGDGGSGSWIQNGVTGQTVSQSPAQLGDALLNDASGNQWKAVPVRGLLSMSSIGGIGDYDFTLETGTDNRLVWKAATNFSARNNGIILIDGYFYLDMQVADNSAIGSVRLKGEGKLSCGLIRKEAFGVTSFGILSRYSTPVPATPFFSLFEADGVGFYGQYSDGDPELASTTFLVLQSFDSVIVKNCHFANIGTLVTAFDNCTDVEMTGNSVVQCARDGLRATGCRHVNISGNFLSRVFDDSIVATIGSRMAFPLETSCVISNNILVDCQGIHGRGGHNSTITGNTLLRPQRRAISFEMGEEVTSFAEGIRATNNLTITGNTIIDPMPRARDAGAGIVWETTTSPLNYVRVIEVSGPSQNGVSTAKYDGTSNGGTVDSNRIVEPYGLYQELDPYNQTEQAASDGIIISNNNVTRTQKLNVPYSDWGLGLPPSIDGIAPDLQVTPLTWLTVSVTLRGKLQNVKVVNNNFTGMNWGVVHDYTSATDAINTLEVRGNTFKDIVKNCVGNKFNTGDNYAPIKSLIVKDNSFDSDPYFKVNYLNYGGHTDDGKWVLETFNAIGFDYRAVVWLGGNAEAPDISGNEIKNCNLIFSQNMHGHTGAIIDESRLISKDNKIWVGIGSADGAPGMGNNNIAGVNQVLNARSAQHYIYYDADVDSVNFGDVQGSTLYAGGLPTTGYYFKGHRVSPNNPTATIPNSILRITTGTGHVLNIDWIYT